MATPQTGKTCCNCDAPLTGAYCASCGQRHIEGELTLGFLGNSVFDAITNADSRLLRTCKALLLQPGFVAKQYVSGCRQQYLNPIRLCLVIIGSYLALLALNGWLAPSAGDVLTQGDTSQLNTRLFSVEFYRAWYDLYSNHRLFIYLGAMPLAALAIKYSFYKSGYNYVATLIMLLYVGALYCFYGILLVITYATFDFDFFSESRKLSEAAIGLITYYQAIKTFYGFSLIRSLVATLWVFVLLIVSAYLVTFLTSGIIISIN